MFLDSCNFFMISKLYKLKLQNILRLFLSIKCLTTQTWPGGGLLTMGALPSLLTSEIC